MIVLANRLGPIALLASKNAFQWSGGKHLESSDLVIAAFSGGASGSLLAMFASFMAHQWRQRSKKDKFKALTEFIVRHAERSIASINLVPEETSEFRLKNRLMLCLLGDVISPKELIELSAESGAIGERALTISMLVRNSDVIISNLVESADDKSLSKSEIISEAKTNMQHLHALAKSIK